MRARLPRALTGPHTEYPPSRFGANERTRRPWFGILVVVPDEQLTRDDRVIRVRFAADPASVPGARRFVADGLRAWGLDALVDDAALCVSELAGNAALHGNSTYIEVSVLDLDRRVRLCVEDDGPTPAAAVVPRTTLPGRDDAVDDELDDLLSAPATGRGLAIVSVLARDWGVEELSGGKRVWADLSPTDDEPGAGGRAERSHHHRAGSGIPVSQPSDLTMPDGWVLVRLARCPVELSLRQDEHLDELVRELTLMSLDKGSTGSARLAQRLEAILRAPAHARLAGRRQAKAALERGELFVDVEMAMPREFSREVRRLHEAVAEADRLCDEQRLLTLASSPEVREFRTWMTEEIEAQVEKGTEPVAWTDWLARR